MPKFSKNTGYKMKGWGGYQKSPLKQDLSTPEADKIRERTATYLESKSKQDLVSRAPWSEDVKKQYKETYDTGEVDAEGNPIMKPLETQSPTSEGGYDYDFDKFSDENINKYKTKEQIKQDKKTAKLKAKSYGSEDDYKYTKEEKYINKMNVLADKYQRARGTGAMGLSFNWKNMLLGGDIASGFKVEPKKDILARKIEKKATKRRDKKLKETRKIERKELRLENKQRKQYERYKKKYKPQFKTDDPGPESFENWRKGQK